MLETDARDRVIVALDCDRERALELAHELSVMPLGSRWA